MSAWAPPSTPGIDAPAAAADAAPARPRRTWRARLAEWIRPVRHILAAVVAAAGLAAAVAFASRSGGLPGHHDPGRPSRNELLPRVALGAIAGTALAFGAAYLLHLRFAPIMKSGRRRRFGRTATMAAPLLVLAGGFGSLAGASTTPLRQKGAITRDAGFTLTARPVDADGDGRPDADDGGNAVLGLDLDGDGRVDRILPHCPGSKAPTLAQIAAAAQPGAGRIQVAVDTDCDGVPERILYLDPRPAPTAPEAVQPDGKPTPVPTDLLNRSADRMKDTFAALAVAAVAVLIGLVLVAAVLVLRGGRGRPPVRPDDELPPLEAEGALDRSRAAEAFGESIDAMLTDPDPRTGIIGAYAKLLDGLGAAGLPRRPEEAPLEHLARCLGALEVPPAPLQRLTELFEVARFSTHPMHEGHRLDALDALRAALGHLSEQPEPVTGRHR